MVNRSNPCIELAKKTEDNDNEGAYDPSNDNVDDKRSKPRNRYRPIRVVLENEDAKWKLVKSAPNIKQEGPEGPGSLT